MSCTSPFTVASTTVPLPAASAFSMSGSRYATAAFIVSADCSTNGSCISPRPEQLADDLHPVEQHVVHDLERGPRRELLVEGGLEPVAVAVDDAVLQSLLDRPTRTVFLLDRAGFHALEQRHELGERVVVVTPAVVDQVECDLALALVDRFSGTMRAAWTIAASSPASRHSCRNTLLSTWRAAGLGRTTRSTTRGSSTRPAARS